MNFIRLVVESSVLGIYRKFSFLLLPHKLYKLVKLHKKSRLSNELPWKLVVSITFLMMGLTAIFPAYDLTIRIVGISWLVLLVVRDLAYNLLPLHFHK